MRFRDILINIFTSGKSPSYGKYKEEKVQERGFSDYLIKYVLLNFINIFGFIVLVLFVFHNIAINSYFDAVACASLAFTAIMGFIISRTKIAQMVPAVISSISYGLFCVLVIWNGDAHGAGFLFIFIYPMFMIMLLGMVKGIIFSAVLLVIVIVEFFVPGTSRFEYHLDISLRMIAVYILVTGTTLVFETSRKNKDRVNEKLTAKIIGINENLQNIVEERTKKIVKLQNSILKTMSNLVEYRDFVTGEHIERTQYGVNLLLDEIKRQKLFAEIIDDWDINLILQSVQLHDVGKIAISDLILDLFGNPVGCLTSPAFLGLKPRKMLFFRGSCSETEVSEQLY